MADSHGDDRLLGSAGCAPLHLERGSYELPAKGDGQMKTAALPVQSILKPSCFLHLPHLSPSSRTPTRSTPSMEMMFSHCLQLLGGPRPLGSLA